jgi:hypothetical protein
MNKEEVNFRSFEEIKKKIKELEERISAWNDFIKKKNIDDDVKKYCGNIIRILETKKDTLNWVLNEKIEI